MPSKSRSAAGTPSRGSSSRSTPSNPPSTTATTASTTSSAATPTTSQPSLLSALTSSSKSQQSVRAIAQQLWDNYVANTPQRVKLLDAFLAFLVAVGGVQFLYCILAGSYPFNAFLSGFSATVGQFVLTVSLRMQTNPENGAAFGKGMSQERAFADYVLGSLILHFFCVNFVN